MHKRIQYSVYLALRMLVGSVLLACGGLAQESPHGNIQLACNTCHTTDSWKMNADASFDHQSTGFALTGQHTSLRCESCHQKLVFAHKSSACLSCHADIHKSELGADCLRCHTTQSWNIPDMMQRHQSTRFPLLGRHATLDCQSCHPSAGFKQYTGIPLDCYGCHRADYAGTQSPNHLVAGFPTNCVQCHQVTAAIWGTGFQHNQTGFPLTGAHLAAACFDCHQNRVFKGIATTCVSCHQPAYISTKSPNHTAARFTTDCQSCHATTAWQGGLYDHNQTQFPLLGAHRVQGCIACHADNVFIGKSVDCVSCHRPEFNTAQNPNHVTAGISTQCQTCHSSSAWHPSTFSHATTRFPLTGAHLAVTCAQCHASGQFATLSTNCVDCHQTDFNNSLNPKHVAGIFGTNCIQCHTTTAWHPAQFDHSTTRFVLTGVHVGTQCVACHVSSNYKLTYVDCYQCHQSIFQQPTNPNHVLGNFKHDCAPCHTTTVWKPSTFSHATTTFPLVGAHQTVACNQCHVNNQFQNLLQTCWDCHGTDFTKTTNPNHVAGQFNHDCTQCHSQNAWQPATFNHANTKFPLTGVHTTTACVSCHTNGNYQLQYTICYPCHTTQFAQPTNPNHVLGNFNHDCAPCHTTTVWKPSTFSHATTTFPLVGAHQTVACNQCHVNNQFQNLLQTCWDCHGKDFTSTTNPGHVAGQFGHDCTLCHTQNAWQPATFNHANTKFPLTGVHTTTACASCHTNGNYQLQYTICYPCHTTQFAQPTTPNHVLGNFNHDCAPCHTTTVWKPSTFSHATTTFPLVGAHQAVACNQCHVNNQFQNLLQTCWDCHGTDFTNTTNPGHVAGQFGHDCTLCHTQNAWQPATFNHANTKFPLTGVHTTTACASCHTNGNYQLQYKDCYQCHATDYARPTSPNHVAQIFPKDCTMCHSTSVWTPNTMNHDAAWFRIYSGNHRGAWTQCNQCHTSPGNLAAFSCTTGCHQTAHHQGENCYSCHQRS